MSRSFIIDDTCVFVVNSHTPTTGAAVDADADPGYRIYEDETGTPILTGTMAKLDDANTVGFYSESITLSAANGFEYGKSYCIRKTVVVGGVTGTDIEYIQMGARVDTRLLVGDAQSATDLKDFADAGYDPSTNKVQGVVLTDTLTTYTGNTVQTGDSFGRIGVAGAGLTNIDLPNQTFDLTGNITGNLSGSVGSVSGAVGSVTGNVGGNVTGTVGSVVGAVGSVAGNVGGNVTGTVGSVVGAVGSVTGNVGGNVTGSVGSVTGLTVSNLDATVSSRATPAQVNAEVLDVLNVDTFAQPGQATPAATTTIRLMLNYLYKAFRNRTTQTATEYNLFNDDAATVDQKATFSDDGTTADRTEISTGP